MMMMIYILWEKGEYQKLLRVQLSSVLETQPNGYYIIKLKINSKNIKEIQR